MISLSCSSCGQKNDVESFLTAARQACAHCGQPIMGSTLAQAPTGPRPWERMEHAPEQVTAASRSMWVTSLAWVNFAFGGLYLLCGSCFWLAGGVLESAVGRREAHKQGVNPEELQRAAGKMNVVAAIMAILAIPIIVGGIGLLYRAPWGRTLTLISAGLAVVLCIVCAFLRDGYFAGLLAAYAGLAFFILFHPGVAAEFGVTQDNTQP